MTPTEMKELARRLKLNVDESALSKIKLVRAIEAKLLELQPSTVAETSTEYRELIDARQLLKPNPTAAKKPSAELVTVPAQLLSRILDIVESKPSQVSPPSPAVAGATPVKAMKKSVKVATTKATSDFRRDRTFPLASLGIVAAAAWAARDSLGVDLSVVGTQAWMYGTAVVISFSALVLLYSSRAQVRDERILRRLYTPEVQELAFLYFAPVSSREMKRRSKRDVSNSRFISPREYAHVLFDIAEVEEVRHRERSSSLLFSARRVRYRGLRASTVDLEAAVEDAANLALQRLTELGVIEPTAEVGTQLFEILATEGH